MGRAAADWYHVSDTSQGPGWWLASDGRWYPPASPPVAAAAVPAAPPMAPPVQAGEWHGPRCATCSGGLEPGAVLCPWCGATTDPLACTVCGATPAVEAEFRRNTGLFIMFRTETFGGRHCRECGIARFRDTTNHTLFAGWWGLISFVLNWVFLALNVASWRKVAALPTPLRDPRQRPPLAMGRPLVQRFGIWVPIALALVIGVGAVTAEDPKTDGFTNVYRAEDLLERCIEVVDDEVGEVPCDGPNDGRVTAVAEDDLGCPATSVGSFSLDGIGGKVACVSR